MDQQILYWAANLNFKLMSFAALYMRDSLYLIALLFTAIGITPLSPNKDQSNVEAMMVFTRKILLYSTYFLTIWIALMAMIFEFTNSENDPENFKKYLTFLNDVINPKILGLIVIGTLVLKMIYFRYLIPSVSSIKRKFRNVRSDEKESDIRDEKNSTKLKSFNPQKYYKKDHIFIALDEHNKPLYVPIETWRKTNMQIIGPTRYGKGVAIGVIADQVIKRGDSVIYIDPKNDEFIPQIMYQAALEAGRPFVYLTLHDHGMGYYSPFKGGSERDGLSRLMSAFKLETTGHPGTDYYKRIETEILTAAFKTGRSINHLLTTLRGNEKTSSANAEMAAWAEIKTLCPPKSASSFSVKKALLDGTMVYVQGKLDDAVVKTATNRWKLALNADVVRSTSWRGDNVARLSNSPWTIQNREFYLRYFIIWADERGLNRPNEITKPIIESYQRYLYHYRKANGESLSVMSQNGRIITIRGLFKWLERKYPKPTRYQHPYRIAR